MVGLRTYTTLDPNVWKFPQWANNVFYPVGSFVATGLPSPADSENVIFTYYVSLQDVNYDTKTDQAGNVIVDGGSWAPNDSDSDWTNHSIYGINPWAIAFDTTSNAIEADLVARLAALDALYPLLGIDSDIGVLYRADSDFTVKDSDQDSDIRMAYHNAWMWDSDRDSEAQRRDDSDRHDHKAADSDIIEWLKSTDSDLDSERHARMAADSDLQIQIFDNDSDIQQRWHDTLGLDSDRDSDLLVLHLRDDSDSDRLVNFIHRYEQRDSDIKVRLDDADSDISWLYTNMGTGSNVAGGFHAGTVLQFATMNLPTGFLPCDGRTFNPLAFPDLFTILGSNQVPDLRNKFIRGYNDDSDGFGNVRILLSDQDNTSGPHRHYMFTKDGTFGGTVGADTFTSLAAAVTDDGGFDNVNFEYSMAAMDTEPDRAKSGLALDPNTNAVNDETRPDNTMLVFGIAMYTGAGVIYDSDIIESILRIRLADHDSDILALYNRTDFYKETYSPTLDQLDPIVYTIAEDSSTYTDIEVLLNGVEVTNWSAVGAVFTLDFSLRGGVDAVTFKLRR